MNSARFAVSLLVVALGAPRGALTAETLRKQSAEAPQCPHFVPPQGASCALSPVQACTFSESAGLRICTCRPDRRWFCELMTPPPPAPPAPRRGF